MTLSFENFHEPQPYQGIESIYIEDGKRLVISHIGTIKLKTTFGSLILENHYMCLN